MICANLSDSRLSAGLSQQNERTLNERQKKMNKMYKNMTMNFFKLNVTLTTLMTSSSHSSLVNLFLSLLMLFLELREGGGIRLLRRFGTEENNGKFFSVCYFLFRVLRSNSWIGRLCLLFNINLKNENELFLNLMQLNDCPFSQQGTVYPQAAKWRLQSPKAANI